MSGEPRDDAFGLRRLLAGEEATAAAEFVVLIPVYMLLLTGLFMTGNLMQARQALVQAARFEAWTGVRVGAAGTTNYDAFFHGIPGEYRRVRDPGLQAGVKLTDGGEGADLGMAELTAADLDPNAGGADDARRFGGLNRGPDAKAPYDEGAAREIAARVLNNAGEGGGYSSQRAPLAVAQVEASFTYTGVLLRGLPGVTQSTQAAVVLERDVERPVYDPARGHPVATHWRTPARSFQPEEYPPFSPYFEGFLDRDGANPGVWDVDARLRGSESSERGYIRSYTRRVGSP